MTATADLDGTRPAAADGLYKFMMESMPYRYDEGVEPRFLTRQEAEDEFPDEAAKATRDGPGGMIYEVVGPAAEYGGERKLTPQEEEYIFLKRGGEGLWWHYSGEYNRVTKAMKIPYVVMQAGKKVVKHILVGFSGIDGPP